MPPVRRLTAILAADVVGYSRLMGVDEEGTHERLKAHLVELLDPKNHQASRPDSQDHRRWRAGGIRQRLVSKRDRAARHMISHNNGRAYHRDGSLLTHCWREMDSNFQYAGAVNLVVALLGGLSSAIECGPGEALLGLPFGPVWVMFRLVAERKVVPCLKPTPRTFAGTLSNGRDPPIAIGRVGSQSSFR
jgi:hypothetical protein